MTTTPNKYGEDHLADSWIEIPSNMSIGWRSPERITPPLPFSSGEEYLRLLKEAQKESNQSSRVVSLAGSRKVTPGGSPKSPPNSPNIELQEEDELKGVYINYWNKDGEIIPRKSTEWVCDWDSRPDMQPPKNLMFKHPKKRTAVYSMRSARVGNNSLFSKEVLYSLILTNVLSLLFGTGIGLYLSKRGNFLLTRISIE